MLSLTRKKSFIAEKTTTTSDKKQFSMIYDGEKIKMIYDQPTERLDSYVMQFGS